MATGLDCSFGLVLSVFCSFFGAFKRWHGNEWGRLIRGRRSIFRSARCQIKSLGSGQSFLAEAWVTAV
jgi:hypothetical protein